MTTHRNNFGIIRLLLATLVIVSHAHPQINGDNRLEPLRSMSSVLTIGDLSVGGFFAISGYLIAKSMEGSTSVLSYLSKRVIRIWPAYLVCALVCTFIVGPMVGGYDPLQQGWQSFVRMVFLLGPVETPSQLPGLPVPVLNGSLWTIPLEFGCYLVIAGLGLTGLLRSRTVVLGITAAALIACFAATFAMYRQALDSLGHPGLTIFLHGPPMRLLAFFMVGTTLYRIGNQLDRLLVWRNVLPAAVLAIAALASPHLAVPAVAIFGSILLFCAGLKWDIGPWQAINDRWDISYGTYLYGWPIAMMLLYFDRDQPPWQLIVTAIPLAWACGAVSWWLVERPAKSIVHKLVPSAPRPNPRVQERTS